MPFPRSTLGLRIEMAFGADPAGSPFEWVWTDLSDRLLYHRINVRRGRADESSVPQPSQITFELDNTDGALTPGNPASPFFPHVRRGTPVRAWVEGAEVALYIPDESGSASTPDVAALDVPGDLDVRVRVQPDQWANTSRRTQRLINKGVSPDRSWDLFLLDSGRPGLDWETVGGGFASSSGGTVDVVHSLRAPWIAATIDINNGAGGQTVRFYRFDDDPAPADVTTWTPVGEAVNNGDTTALVNSAGPLTIARSLQGRVLAAEVRSGINGTVVTNPDFAAQSPGVTAFVDGAGRSWTVNGPAVITDEQSRFVGQVDEIVPTWPYRDHNAASPDPSESRVQFSASGPLRRLTQGAKPLRSALYRRAVLEPLEGFIGGGTPALDVYAYWPCEDNPGSVQAASGLVGAPGLSYSGPIGAGADASLNSSGPLPNIAAGETVSWSGAVPTDKDFFDAWAVEMLFRLPTPETSPAATQLIVVDTAGAVAGVPDEWRFSINDTNARLVVVDALAGVLVDSTVALGGTEFGPWVILRIDADGFSPGTVNWSWTMRPLSTGVTGGTSGSFAAPAFNRPAGVSASLTGPPDGISFGHIVTQSGFLPAGWRLDAAYGWVGESAARRFWRLCAEQNVQAEIVGDPTVNNPGLGDLSGSEPIGPQRQETFVDLLNECAAVDQGAVISNRRTPGLIYRTRQSIEAQPSPRVALDAAAEEITNPVEPRLDDQRLRNDITVSSTTGSSARVVDQASIDTEGLYDEEIEINGVGGSTVPATTLSTQPGLAAAVDSQNLIQARRRLHLARSTDMRYPTVAIDLATAAAVDVAGTRQLIRRWHDLELGDRVTLANLPSQLPATPVELVVEAINETLGPTLWQSTLTCSPGDPWLNPYTATPIVESTTTGSATSATSGTINMPTAVAANDILVILGTWSGNAGTPQVGSVLGTWTELANLQINGEFGQHTVWIKRASGSEGGATESWTSVGSGGSKTLVYHAIRISGAETTGTPWAFTAGTRVDNTSTIDPPSVTAPWGPANNLFLALASSIFSGATITAYPAGYNAAQTANAASGSATGSCSKDSTAASDDPGTFTLSAAADRTAGSTLVIQPD